MPVAVTVAGKLFALEPADQYTNQVDIFSRAVRGEIALPYGPEDAVRNMRVIDALYRSEKSGRWEEER